MTTTTLQTSSASAVSITSAQTVGGYTPGSRMRLRPVLRLSSLNASAATFSVFVRNTTDGADLYGYADSKRLTSDTAKTMLLPAFDALASKVYAVVIQSSNSNDTSVSWVVDWFDATVMDAGAWGGSALPTTFAASNLPSDYQQRGQPVTLPTGTGAGQIDLSGGKVQTRLNSADVTGNVPANVNAITGAVQTALALAIQAGIIDDTDGQAVLTAIVNKINATDVNLAGLSTAAIAAAVWQYLLSDATAAGSTGKFIADLSSGTVKLNVGTAVSVTGNVGGSVIGNVGGSIGSISGVVITDGFLPVDADAIASAVNTTEQQQQLAANAVAAKVAAESANDRIGDGSQDTDVARINSIPGALPLADEDRLMIEGLQDTANELAAVAPDHKPAVDAQGRVTTANPATAAPQINAEGNRVTGGKP